VVKRFNCLRHDAVVCCNNEHSNICDLGTASTHRRKGFVARCIDKGDCAVNAIMIMVNLISTDVLSNSTRFALNHFSLTNCIKERCLTVINVTHNSYYWWAGNEIIGVHIF
jgi:hypothetical protein